MGKLGIIGGMGPAATQLLYKRIIDLTDAKRDQDHIDMIILSHASIPDRTAAIKSGNTHEVFHALLTDAKMLEENGADAIAIPCNTSHYFHKPLQAEMEIPIINMVRRTVERIKEENPDIKRIGVLATDGTIYTGIYKKECERVGAECIIPDEYRQKTVMSIIYDQIKQGKPGDPEDFKTVEEYLRSRGTEKTVLACTELSCYAKTYSLGEEYTDALDVLASEAIVMCGGKLKK